MRSYPLYSQWRTKSAKRGVVSRCPPIEPCLRGRPLQERRSHHHPLYWRPGLRFKSRRRAPGPYRKLAFSADHFYLARQRAQAPQEITSLPAASLGDTTGGMRVSFLLLIAALLSGCASNPTPVSTEPSASAGDPSDGWIHGSLSCLEDGTVYSFRIQKKIAWGGSATGGIVALNSTPRARFSGQYTGILPGGRANAWANASAWDSNGGYASANTSSFSTWRSTVANAEGTMADGSGTLIQIAMQINAGWSPHGIGQGIDNKGRHYSIQF